MKPLISKTSFGSITIAGTTYGHDVIIRLNGAGEKRKKKLSKAVYGSSHTVSKEEAKHVYEKGAEHIIIGTGQNDILHLSGEAREYFNKKECRVDLASTPEAATQWNNAKEHTIGLFHVTC